MLHGTFPASNAKDQSFHWLDAERADGPSIAQWMGNMWYCMGETLPVTPEELRKRGWEYLGPVTNRLHSDYIDF